VDDKGKKCKYSAPQYIDSAMSALQRWIQDGDTGIPIKSADRFPPQFETLLRRTLRVLWTVLGHLTDRHWVSLVGAGLQSQAVTLTAHMHCFCAEFGLLDTRDATSLSEHVQTLCRRALAMTAQTMSHEQLPITVDSIEPMIVTGRKCVY
jgi:hypothetical protein